MPLPVSLQSVASSLGWYSDESSTYLHKPTGEIVTIDHSLLRRVEEVTLRLKQTIKSPKAKFRGETKSRMLPASFRPTSTWRFHPNTIIDEWSVMDEPMRTVLANAIHGRGAFRSFKDEIQASDRAEVWCEYREAAYRSQAREWLDQHHIPYADDRSSPEVGV